MSDWLLAGLRHFLWTSPRAHSDVTRDVSVLLRILAPRAQDGDTDPHLFQALLSSGNALPEKSRQNAGLQSICASTSQARAAALAASFRKVIDSVELGDETIEEDTTLHRLAAMPPSYVDSGSANSNMLHKPTGVELQTRALSSLMNALNVLKVDHNAEVRVADASSTSDAAMAHHDEDDDEVVEEWEALRDVVCQRRTGPSTSRLFAGLSSGPTSGFNTPSMGWASSRPPSPPAPHEDIDGGRALQRIYRRWKQQIDNGELDRHI